MCHYTEDELALMRWFDEGNPNCDEGPPDTIVRAPIVVCADEDATKRKAA